MLDSSGSDLLSDCSHAPSDYELKDVAPVAAEMFLQRPMLAVVRAPDWNATNEKQLRALVKNAVD